MTVVVSDTSPLRALEWVGALEILGHLFGRVLVPPAVVEELRHADDGRFREIDVSKLPFVEIVSPKSRAAVEALLGHIDLGEAEALVVAQELAISSVLVDDMDARRKAAELGISVVGTLGILLKAKRAGLVTEVRPMIERLREELAFFLSDSLVAEVLRQAGE